MSLKKCSGATDGQRATYLGDGLESGYMLTITDTQRIKSIWNRLWQEVLSSLPKTWRC